MRNLDIKDKPITLFVAGLPLGLGIIIGVGMLLYTLVGPFIIVANDGSGMTALALISVAPFLLLYALQVAVFIVIGFLLLKGVYNWSSPSIIMSAIASPIVYIGCFATIALQFNYVINASTPVGIIFLCSFALTPLITGAIAYNDIRYRLPKIKKYPGVAESQE